MWRAVRLQGTDITNGCPEEGQEDTGCRVGGATAGARSRSESDRTQPIRTHLEVFSLEYPQEGSRDRPRGLSPRQHHGNDVAGDGLRGRVRGPDRCRQHCRRRSRDRVDD
jgi:hypothetical protein